MSTLILALGAAVVDPALTEHLEAMQEGEYVEVVAQLAQRPDHAWVKQTYGKDYKAIVRHYREHAARASEGLMAFLNARSFEVKEAALFWTGNCVVFTAGKSVVEAVGGRSDVALLSLPDEPVLLDVGFGGGGEHPDAVSWGVTKIGAEQCWDQGWTGAGVLLGMLDTGLYAQHPAIAPHWSGLWKDFTSENSSVPIDPYGHGQHVAGIMVGGDGRGPFTEDIGVAPGDTNNPSLISCARVFNSAGSTTTGWILAAFDWYASLVGDSGYNVVAVNNSWGSSNTTNTTYWDGVLVLRNLDIVPVFGSGAGGPPPGTASTPGNYPTVICTGVSDSSDYVGSMSGRGPAPNQPPWNDTTYWSRSDWDYLKPELLAPGISIYSSFGTGSYTNMSGSSMATPHATGCLGILFDPDVNPAHTYQTAYDALFYAPPEQPSWGAPYPNNSYGNGRLDCYAAAQYLAAEERGPDPGGLTFKLLTNPAKDYVQAAFTLPSAGSVRLEAYDALGRSVGTLYSGAGLSAGEQSATLDITRLPAGVYLLRLTADGRAETARLVVSG